jgi:hypothetical protein
MGLRPTTVPMWAMVLALIGNVLLGFAVAGVGRVQTGEPGLWASAATAFPLAVVRAGEPPNSHLPVDPFRGDLVEYLLGQSRPRSAC